MTVFGCGDATVDPNAGGGTGRCRCRNSRGNARRLTIICAEDAMGRIVRAIMLKVFSVDRRSLRVRLVMMRCNAPCRWSPFTFKLLSTSGLSAPNNTIDGSSLARRGVQTDSSGVATRTIAIGTVESTFLVGRPLHKQAQFWRVLSATPVRADFRFA